MSAYLIKDRRMSILDSSVRFSSVFVELSLTRFSSVLGCMSSLSFLVSLLDRLLTPRRVRHLVRHMYATKRYMGTEKPSIAQDLSLLIPNGNSYFHLTVPF